MKPFRELVDSPSYHFAKLQNKLYREIHEFLQAPEMNKSKLAKKLGVSKGYITQVLNNGADHRLSNFIKLSLAIGKVPQVEFIRKSEYIESEILKRIDVLPLDLDSHQFELKQLDKIELSEKTKSTINLYKTINIENATSFEYSKD